MSSLAHLNPLHQAAEMGRDGPDPNLEGLASHSSTRHINSSDKKNPHCIDPLPKEETLINKSSINRRSPFFFLAGKKEQSQEGGHGDGASLGISQHLPQLPMSQLGAAATIW